MPTVINTNLASLFAQNSLTNAQNNLAQSVQRLSSGLRINSAKDDAAGLAIAQLMQSNINGVNQSIRNMSNATNLLQTADTALTTIQDMLLRMKQLSVQGYDGSISNPQRMNVVTELKDLRSEIDAIANRTTFNNINLLGSAQGVANATGDIMQNQFLTLNEIEDSGAGGITNQIKSTVTNNIISGTAATREVSTVTFGALVQNDTVTINGLTLTANNAAGLTATAVANAFANITAGSSGTSLAGQYTFTGTLNDWSSGDVVVDASLNKVAFTAKYVGNVTNITATDTAAGSNVSVSTVAGVDATTSVKSQYSINISDPTSDRYQYLPGNYTFSNRFGNNQLTLSGNINGQYSEQTLTVADVDLDPTSTNPVQQTLNFSTFGIDLRLDTIVATGQPKVLGSTIVSNMAGASINIVGDRAKITNIDVANASEGVYRFTNPSGSNLKIDFYDGTPSALGNLIKSETLDLATVGAYNSAGTNNFEAGKIYKLDFKAMGVALDVQAFQTITSANIADLIADLNKNLDGTAGNLYIAAGQTTNLKFQSGPNSDSFIQINTLDIKTTSGSSNKAMQSLGAAVDNLTSLNLSSTDTAWQNGFMDLDSKIEAAQVYLSQERAVYGSQMNRIQYLSTNLTSQSTNLQNSRSSIIDTDFASETAKLTRGQIMQQAATAMLAQANQMPNVVLSLLK